MPAGSDFNNQQLKQNAQYLQMRGAQIAQQQAGQETDLSPAPKASGSKKQLIGTISIFVGVAALLFLLSLLDLI